MNRPVSVRRSIFSSTLALILLLAAAIMAATVVGNRELVRELSSALVRQTLDQTAAYLDSFFRPVKHLLSLSRRWGEQGLLDPDRPEAAIALLQPVLQEVPHVGSLLLADAGDGAEVMLLEREEGWHSRLTRPDAQPGEGRIGRWTRGQRWRQRTEEAVPLDYDARRRPWFTGAMAANQAVPGQVEYWTTPYTFFTTGEPGITATTTFTAPGGRVHVMGFDLLLRAISEFTAGLAATPQGVVIVLSDDGRVLGLPAAGPFTSERARAKALLTTSGDLRWPLFDDAVAHLDGAGGGVERSPVRFDSGEESYWVGRVVHRLADERALEVTVILPEANLLAGLQSIRAWIAVITLFVLALAVVHTARLARRYADPLERLARESARIARGDLSRGEPVDSPVKEVRRLADAHERMREGLQALMRLERDLQLAREIQHSTFPDRLPRVREFQIAAWSEPAEATGGDSYDVVGYRRGPDGAVRLARDEAPRALLFMADATGHGVGPALSATQVRAMLRMGARTGVAAGAIVRHINEQLCADLHEGRFITAWLGDLDGETATLHSFSAGQAPLLHLVAERGEVRSLQADHIPLGVMSELPLPGPTPVELAPGDVFAVISDGVFEAVDASGEAFGEQRVHDLLRRQASAGARALADAIRAELEAFTGATPAGDDRTVLILRRD